MKSVGQGGMYDMISLDGKRVYENVAVVSDTLIKNYRRNKDSGGHLFVVEISIMHVSHVSSQRIIGMRLG